MTTKIELTSEEWKRIQRQLSKLNALESGGVDNWDYYGESLNSWFKENEIDELLDNAIIDISELTAEAEVDQPAGHGCGYCIKLPEDSLRKILLEFGKNYHDITNDTNEEQQ